MDYFELVIDPIFVAWLRDTYAKPRKLIIGGNMKDSYYKNVVMCGKNGKTYADITGMAYIGKTPAKPDWNLYVQQVQTMGDDPVLHLSFKYPTHT